MKQHGVRDSVSTAIVTVDPYNQGGVRTMMTTIYQILESWQMHPRLFHIMSDPPLPGKKLLSGLRSYATERLGMRSFTMPSFPLSLWLWNLIPLLFGWHAIKQDTVHISVGGASHVALLLAIKRMRYILWVATLYQDELQAKVNAGDLWARRILASPTWKILKAQELLSLRRAARIMALSPYTASRIKELLPDIADRVEVMVFPVDTDRYNPASNARAESKYGNYLLFVARINDPRKNAPMLLRAFSEIKSRHPDLKLILAGDHPDSTLINLVNELDLRDRVVFPGAFEPGSDELLSLYQGAQLFVLPSIQEGLGIVALEAMACGVPVVSTMCGGTDGIVIDDQTGRLVPNNNASAMAEAISDLLQQPALLANMRAECVRTVQQHYARTAIKHQLWHVLNQVFPHQMTQLQSAMVADQSGGVLESAVNG